MRLFLFFLVSVTLIGCSGLSNSADDHRSALRPEKAIISYARTAFKTPEEFGASLDYLEKDAALQKTFRRVGYVDGQRPLRFTAQSGQHSIRCVNERPFDDKSDYRCFLIVASQMFVRLAQAREITEEIDRSGSVLHPFLYHVAPKRTLGHALATDGALVCHDLHDKPITWRGTATNVYGVVDETTSAGAEKLQPTVESTCPIPKDLSRSLF